MTFLITVDETTSLRNRRYMNLNVHYGGGHRSLGLIRIVNSMISSKVIKLVVSKLNQIGLDLEKDIVASTIDAASVLVKFG